MPRPAEQTAIVPPEEHDFAVIRLLLRPGTWYEDQRERFKPFNRLVEPDEGMRADVVTVTKRLLARKNAETQILTADTPAPFRVSDVIAFIDDELG